MSRFILGVTMAAVCLLAGTGIALAGGQPTSGSKSGTTIAGKGPSTFPFVVASGQLSLVWHDGLTYTWDAGSMRYEHLDGWVSFNTAGAGWEHEAPGTGHQGAGSYSPAP
ncbi:MAG: hypothetical protein AB7U23_11245 [Dehalococcoidia bacterium]